MAFVDIDELITIKDRLAPELMSLAGVRAVGVRSQGLTVYLETDSPAIRNLVRTVVDKQVSGSDIPVHFATSEKFRAAGS